VKTKVRRRNRDLLDKIFFTWSRILNRAIYVSDDNSPKDMGLFPRGFQWYNVLEEMQRRAGDVLCIFFKRLHRRVINLIVVFLVRPASLKAMQRMNDDEY